VVGWKYVFCCKFPQVCFYQKLAKSGEIWQSHHKYTTLTFNLRHSVYNSQLQTVDRYGSTGARFCDLHLWTYDLWDLKRSCPDYNKYLCKFWFKLFRWFRSYRVQNISIVVATVVCETACVGEPVFQHLYLRNAQHSSVTIAHYQVHETSITFSMTTYNRPDRLTAMPPGINSRPSHNKNCNVFFDHSV